ncbi:MAG TPA: cyclopropane-fatty-acyl-phospholipid synthase family protein [Woeseiaceae bacterium]|nr:cyclopropane-fatty-acyl-phospholipid synthase family protein [Woeseiaceae bacterium]
MNGMTARALSWTESGMVPDRIVRQGIRRLLERKRREIGAGDPELAAQMLRDFVGMMDTAPVAPVPGVPNEQHYEVPAEFFAGVLGPQRKYSCCYWGPDVGTLEEAEAAGLEITARRADVRDGMRILDLGCGWGSLSLWLAEHFPNARITAVSNSRTQRDTILARVAERSLRNVEVRVCDMNDFDAGGRYDRIVSVEMFEHMRNYRELFRRISDWLEPDGRFFLHIFTHVSTPYEYVDKGPGDWMSRHFFSGGIMPAAELPLWFQDHLAIERTWRWNGGNYAQTCNAWLERMDLNRQDLLPVLAAAYGDEAERWWMRWRMFFMACAELFAYANGREWFVSHYRFRKAGR